MAAGGILMGFGTLSILYFVLYAVLVDLNNIFTYFWLLLGIVLFAAGFLTFRLYQQGGAWPKKIWVPAVSLCGAAALFFAAMICVIAYEAWQKPAAGADYLMVLGARVRGERVSALLRERLDTALEYLSDNPDTVVIVSGGQGPGEDVPEAVAMQKYLVEHGIEEERILMDTKSRNTNQNMKNSIALIQEEQPVAGQHIVLVSNGFHLFRATRILEKQIENEQDSGGKDGRESADPSAGGRSEDGSDGGSENGNVTVEGLGAPTRWYVAPNSYVREVFAVVKYKLSGQI